MAHHHSTSMQHEPPTSSVEPDHVNIRAVAGFTIGLVVVAVGAHLAMLLMWNVLTNQAAAAEPPRMYPLAPITAEPAFPGDPSGGQPPEPRLQSDPKKELADLRAEEEAILNGYGWVDRNNNVVRIPIENAMRLTLQRGLPSRDAAQPSGAPATQEQGK